MHTFIREINGRKYRILEVTERVPDKKNPVTRQVSLGPIATNELIDSSRCEEAGHLRVGDVAALISIAEELGVLDAFAEAAPRKGTGPNLGELILAVALQRVCAPGPKRDLANFLDECRPRFAVRPSHEFSGQMFHRVTRGVPEEVYEKAQLAIAARACERFRLQTDVLAYDSTNFDTFIATTTDSDLAQRGHAKSKRSDLRVVGLALMTSSTSSVPLFHRTYAGNQSDKTVLAETLDSLATLHDMLGSADRTMVRDGGFAGEQLDLQLGLSGYHSVSVLALSTKASREALTAACGRLKPLPGKLRDISAYRTVSQGVDFDWTLVVVESPELLEGQLRGLRKATKTALRELKKISKRLTAERAGMSRGRRYTATSLRRRIEKLTAREHVREVLDIVIDGEENAPTLEFALNPANRKQLIRERLGKRVLITDQHDWSTERIVKTFRSQWKVERAFRRMKRGGVSPWGPSYQWTNDSLRAHTFAAVLGLQLATLVRLKLERAGIRRSTKEAMRMLGSIRLTRLRIHPEGRGGPRDTFVPARLTKEALKAAQLFGVGQWCDHFSATTTGTQARRAAA